jgi:hypothetical protein
MRIDSSGNLLVGTTSQVNSGKLCLVHSGAGTTGYCASNTDTGGTSQASMTFVRNDTQVGSIATTSTTTAYNTSSDQRLKTNIVNAPSGNIDDVKVRSFDWKSDGSHVQYGFIAQELVEVAPYAVHQPSNPDEMMAVDYSKLVPMMIKEIQDLKQRIKTLENK